MSVAKVKRRCAAISLPRSQVRDRYPHAGPSVAAIHQRDATAWPDGGPKIDEAFLPFVSVITPDEERQVIRGRDGGGGRRRTRLPAV